jgi:hypothetical protein
MAGVMAFAFLVSLVGLPTGKATDVMEIRDEPTPDPAPQPATA